MLLEISQFTGKHLCQSLFFNNVVGLSLLKKRVWHRCFPVNFVKFLTTTFIIEHSRGCFWNRSSDIGLPFPVLYSILNVKWVFLFLRMFKILRITLSQTILIRWFVNFCINMRVIKFFFRLNFNKKASFSSNKGGILSLAKKLSFFSVPLLPRKNILLLQKVLMSFTFLGQKWVS